MFMISTLTLNVNRKNTEVARLKARVSASLLPEDETMKGGNEP